MSKPVIGLLITARLKSHRLPKKVILEVRGKPLISHMLERIKLSKQIDKIIICTSINHQDDPLENIAQKGGVFCYRGSEDDVLARLCEAAEKFGVDFIVNITADCPLIDPFFIDEIISTYRHIDADLIRINNFDLIGQRPTGVKFSALKKICEIKDETETECWMDYFTKSNLFKVFELAVDKKFINPNLKTSIDYPEDYEFIKCLFDRLYVPGKVFLLSDIIELVKKEPELLLINAHCAKQGFKRALATAAPMKLKNFDGEKP